MEKSSFFNSISHDRTYKAEDWAEYFASFIGNGVFPVPSTGLQVLVNEGMTVTVKAGKAWINGYFYYNTSDLAITLATADGVLNRIDRVVVRWDLTERAIYTVVKSSAYSSAPVAPALQRDADIYEISIADIFVTSGTTAIIQANITDNRFNTELCGIVTGVVEQIDVSVITAQFDNYFEMYRTIVADEYSAYVSKISGLESDAEADYNAFVQSLESDKAVMEEEFNTWFESIKGSLDPDPATALAAEVVALQDRVTALEEALANVDVFTAAAWLGNSYLGCAYLSDATA